MQPERDVGPCICIRAALSVPTDISAAHLNISAVMHSIALRNSAKRAAALAYRNTRPLVGFPHLSPYFSHIFVSSASSWLHPHSSALMRPQRPVRTSLLCIYTPAYVYVAASEVSSILESRIAGSSFGGDVQETGRVLTIGASDPR